MKKFSVVLGSFDGVHIGHKKVISLAADGNSFVAAAVYFFIPPAADGQKKELITTEQERLELFNRAGIKQTLCLEFESVRELSPEAFFRFLCDRFNPSVICCGYNYRFGKNAAGNTKLLKELCDKAGIELRVADPVELDGQAVSSTAIRQHLNNGDMISAAKMLGRYYSFSGKVIKGDGRGKILGFPTANVNYPGGKVKVKPGVYISRVTVGKKQYASVTNIGQRPTYPCDNPPTETYILDKSIKLYNKTVKLELIKFLREPKAFGSADELSQAILENAEQARKYFEENL